MTEEQKVQILYDHYKDTFENQKSYLQKRNYYTFICLGLIALFSFQIADPDNTTTISKTIIEKNIGDISVDFKYINNVLTFSLLWIVIMYYQINFLIEKLYRYIKDIEKDLTKSLKPFEITREGKTYLDHFPWLSGVVHRIYSIVFPITLVMVSVVKWLTEIDQFSDPWINGHFLFDTIFLGGIVITSLLYLTNRHFNDFKKKKK